MLSNADRAASRRLVTSNPTIVPVGVLPPGARGMRAQLHPGELVHTAGALSKSGRGDRGASRALQAAVASSGPPKGQFGHLEKKPAGRFLYSRS